MQKKRPSATMARKAREPMIPPMSAGVLMPPPEEDPPLPDVELEDWAEADRRSVPVPKLKRVNRDVR